MIRDLVPDYVNPIGWMLLVFVGIALPILIVRNSRRVGTGRLFLSRPHFYVQTMIFQLIVAGLAAWTAWTHGILAMPLPQRPLLSWSGAIVFYFVMVLTLTFRWPGRSVEAKQRLLDILPRNRRELVPYAGVCVVAGVAEEFVYRGVLTQVLQRIVGIASVTITVVAISFAIAHAMQGWRSVGGIFVIAIGCHALVWLAQSLVPVIVVHLAYDFTAGVLIPRWFRTESISGPPGAAV